MPREFSEGLMTAGKNFCRVAPNDSIQGALIAIDKTALPSLDLKIQMLCTRIEHCKL